MDEFLRRKRARVKTEPERESEREREGNTKAETDTARDRHSKIREADATYSLIRLSVANAIVASDGGREARKKCLDGCSRRLCL